MANDARKLRRGIWRVEGIGGLEPYAQVVDVSGGSSMPLDESTYRERGYEPSFDDLPTEAEYEAGRNT